MLGSIAGDPSTIADKPLTIYLDERGLGTEQRRHGLHGRHARPAPFQGRISGDSLLYVLGALLIISLFACATGKSAQLSDALILDVLRSHASEIVACRRKQQEADPGFAGKITVRLVITNEPTQIAAVPEQYSQTIGAKCVLSEVATWKFPPFTGSAHALDFPVVF